MRAKTILILAMFLTFRAAAQDTPKAQTQCRFPDGKTIRIKNFSERVGSTQLATDESLVTVKGMSVPAGDYIVLPARDSHNNWTLTMRKKTGKRGSSQFHSTRQVQAVRCIGEWRNRTSYSRLSLQRGTLTCRFSSRFSPLQYRDVTLTVLSEIALFTALFTATSNFPLSEVLCDT